MIRQQIRLLRRTRLHRWFELVAGSLHVRHPCSLIARETEVLQAPGGEARQSDHREGPWLGSVPLTVDI